MADKIKINLSNGKKRSSDEHNMENLVNLLYKFEMVMFSKVA
jgi:hypothetical protein